MLSLTSIVLNSGYPPAGISACTVGEAYSHVTAPWVPAASASTVSASSTTSATGWGGGVSLEGLVSVEGLQTGRKANFLHSSLACSDGMVGPCIPFSLTAVSRDSRETLRKDSHYHYSRLARLQSAHKQLFLLSPS